MFYIRSKSIQKIVKLQINIVKDLLMYILLLVQAIVVSFEVPYGWIIALIVFIILMIINYKYVIGVLQLFLSIFKVIKKKKKRG